MIELAVGAEERRDLLDQARHLLVGDPKPDAACPLVERGFGQELAEDLQVETAGAGLIGGDRPPLLGRDLLDALIVDLPEPLDRDVDRADGRHRRAPKALEDVADAPDRKAERQDADHDAHHEFAEPIGGSRPNTAKHEPSCCEEWAGPAAGRLPELHAS